MQRKTLGLLCCAALAVLAGAAPATLCSHVTCAVESIREGVEFGVYDYSKPAPEAGWALATVAQLTKYKQQLIESYNSAGGLRVLGQFSSGNCCFAVQGGKKLILSVTKYGYLFPANNAGQLRCSPGLKYDDAALYKFYGSPTLSIIQNFSEKTACATSHNPGIFIKLKGGSTRQHIRVRHHKHESVCGKYKSLGLDAAGKGIYQTLGFQHQCALVDTGACECHRAGSHPGSHLNKLDPGKVVTAASSLTGIALGSFDDAVRLAVAHAVAVQLGVPPLFVQIHNARASPSGAAGVDFDTVVKAAHDEEGAATLAKLVHIRDSVPAAAAFATALHGAVIEAVAGDASAVSTVQPHLGTVEVKATKYLICSCPNGVGFTSPGYDWTTTSWLNPPRGVASRMAARNACPADNAPLCASCNDGYFLVNENRRCQALTTCDYSVQWRSVEHTLSSDRECTPLTTCTETQYESTEETPTADRVCTDHTTCTATEWQTKAAETHADRECKGLTTCTDTQYESVERTPTADRVCTEHTTCTAAQWQTVAAGTHSDRECKDLTTCTVTQWQTVAPGNANDRECKAHTVCENEQYETVAATATSDRKCASHTQCDANVQFQTKAAGTHHDRECAALTVCSGTQWETNAKTLTSDRTCADHTTCTASQWQTAAAGASSDRECTDHTTCTLPAAAHQAGHFISTEGDGSTDRVCTDLSTCDYSTHYESTLATSHSDRTCTLLTTCDAGEYETTPNTHTSDRKCSPCEHGTFKGVPGSQACAAWAKCVVGQGMSVPGSKTADRQCAACTAGSTFSDVESGATCQDVSAPCGPGFRTTVAATASNDLTCAACAAGSFKATSSTTLATDSCVSWTTCPIGFGMTGEGSATADRKCGPVTLGVTFSATNDGAAAQSVRDPCPAGEHITAPATTSSDMTCGTNAAGTFTASEGQATATAWRTCPAGTGESNTPSADTDRLCESCKLVAHAGSFSSADNGLPCTTADVCINGEYEKVAATLTSDRTCATHAAECASHEYQSQAPTAMQDRECKQKVCNCANGVFTTGDACPKHGDPKCASCTGAFHLANNNKQCDVNICACVHGQVATGADCTAHGATKCMSCNAGFHMEGQDCVITPINGGWSGYSSWSMCTKSCGLGMQSRSRTCTSPSPAHGGAECAGKASQLQHCSHQACPIDGSWSAWSAWGSCSVTCGTSGTQARTRSCQGQANGGAACAGSALQSQSCSKAACATPSVTSSPFAPVGAVFPIEAGASAWDMRGSTSFRSEKIADATPLITGASAWTTSGSATFASNMVTVPAGSSYVETKETYARPLDVSVQMRQSHGSGSPECGVMAVFPDGTHRHSGYNAGLGWWANGFGVGHDSPQKAKDVVHVHNWHTVRVNVAADGKTYFYLDGELIHTSTDSKWNSGVMRFGNNCRQFDYRKLMITTPVDTVASSARV